MSVEPLPGHVSLARLTPAERRLVARLRTPAQVQRWLDGLDYNHERGGPSLKSFRGVMRHKSAHCLEGALAGAFLLERHGHPPVLMDLESDDRLDHVVALFRERGRWGAVGMSKYPGLKGRKPFHRSVRDLAWSYVDPFVDKTGRVRGYGVLDLRDVAGPDWRHATGNVWRIERALYDMPHRRLRASDARHALWKRRYLAWKADHPGRGEPPTSLYPDVRAL
ncbi:MAG: hypothetical protein QOE90_1919 [Thermoplasmata archaeon]|jgi:hypothetical protein|nr:hypothetical protein [Thermoplasmata archaeon]